MSISYRMTEYVPLVGHELLITTNLSSYISCLAAECLASGWFQSSQPIAAMCIVYTYLQGISSELCRPPRLGRPMDLKIERRHYRASVCMVGDCTL